MVAAFTTSGALVGGVIRPQLVEVVAFLRCWTSVEDGRRLAVVKGHFMMETVATEDWAVVTRLVVQAIVEVVAFLPYWVAVVGSWGHTVAETVVRTVVVTHSRVGSHSGVRRVSERAMVATRCLVGTVSPHILAAQHNQQKSYNLVPAFKYNHKTIAI